MFHVPPVAACVGVSLGLRHGLRSRSVRGTAGPVWVLRCGRWQALAACEATNHALREATSDQSEEATRAHLVGQSLIRDLADTTERFVVRTFAFPWAPAWLLNVRKGAYHKLEVFVAASLCCCVRVCDCTGASCELALEG